MFVLLFLEINGQGLLTIQKPGKYVWFFNCKCKLQWTTENRTSPVFEWSDNQMVQTNLDRFINKMS
jgi:ribosomal protein L24E